MSATDAKKDNLPKSALELLEEDDEFEVPLPLLRTILAQLPVPNHFTLTCAMTQEFEGSSWEDSAAKTEDNQLFQDDWEDDNANDDFTQQLRAQIESSST